MLAQSKHSDYQLLHPSVRALYGDLPQPGGKHEEQRQRYMARRLSPAGLHVHDIGANTGYFSFAAIEAGAAQVVSHEGNPEHARFIALAAQALGVQDRLRSEASYFDFAGTARGTFDLTLCLNVLHHLGDDFGDARLGMAQAKDAMLAALNGLAGHTRQLWFQLGFNWKGDRSRPLFPGGTKAELVDFVRSGTSRHWSVEDIAVVNPRTREYEPLDAENVARFDQLGEFLNRPLFRMRSLAIG